MFLLSRVRIKRRCPVHRRCVDNWEFKLFFIAKAGDLIAVSGMDDIFVGETVCPADHPEALPLLRIDPPTLQMTFMTNDSPFVGRDGDKVTARVTTTRFPVADNWFVFSKCVVQDTITTCHGKELGIITDQTTCWSREYQTCLTSNKDQTATIKKPTHLTLEESLEFLNEDELLQLLQKRDNLFDTRYYFACLIGHRSQLHLAAKQPLTGKTMQYFIRQSVYVIMGISLTVLFAQTNPRWWRRPRMLFFGWIFLMGLLAYAKFFTSAINGANGWKFCVTKNSRKLQKISKET